jgi:hypothetical protein
LKQNYKSGQNFKNIKNENLKNLKSKHFLKQKKYKCIKNVVKNKNQKRKQK